MDIGGKWVKNESKIMFVVLLVAVVLVSGCLGEKPTPEPPVKEKLISKIAFASNRDGNFEIYVMNVNGSNQTKLTNNNFDSVGPSWSPEGSKIAFYSEFSPSFHGIYTMNSEGSNLIRLTNTSDRFPTWSPEGSKIAFGSIDGDLYIINSKGSNRIRLTSGSSYDMSPVWSPDGSKIAFTSWPFDIRFDIVQESNIHIIDADGSNRRVLIGGNHSNMNPAWSPDGSKIAFSSNRDDIFRIYIANSDGSNQTRITYENTSAWNPNWSPDDSKIVFVSYPHADINYKIFVIDTDGTNLKKLTHGSYTDSAPDWSPFFERGG